MERHTNRIIATVAVLALLVLVAAGCGDDDTVDATDERVTASDDGDSLTSDEPVDDDPVDDEPVDDEGGSGDDPATGGGPWTATQPMLDIVDPQPHPIVEAVPSTDGAAIHVRYEAATEPCSGAIATVSETETAIEVTLVSGLNPRAATMTCIAQVVGYEQTVALAEPVGARDITIAAN